VEDKTYCGFVAIVGRPNVGKSTLLNHLLQQKISITSRKPQTTRHNVLGIKTEGETQVVFVDTPGIHSNQSKAINRYMNRSASSATKDVDAVIFVVDRDAWVDKLEDKGVLMPSVAQLQEILSPAAIVPISALKQVNLDVLESEIKGFIPEAAFYYPEDQVTDKTSRFMAAELVREKIMRQLGAELPYQVTVEIEEFKDDSQIIHISALVLVEREGQKRIIIGDKGSRLKSIGKAARVEMETMFESKVMLKLWVKVKAGWSDDDRALRSLGYDE